MFSLDEVLKVAGLTILMARAYETKMKDIACKDHATFGSFRLNSITIRV